MKQRITVEQLQELTPEQQQKLRELWKPNYGDCACEVGESDYVEQYKDDPYRHVIENAQNILNNSLPLLDIGQMIELLNNKRNQAETLEIHAPIGLIDRWCVWYANGAFPKRYETHELCDALWESVKEAL